ncbi:type II secretion system F family protein [Yersinia rochesterensis]|uniref:type II secretion system F family protein n=1 Tax=Yersinia rochesterensis TaxID=1604335 RepID=UPI0025AAC57C|nr:type II secretion system F family protein [Yersinia rochesterensis]MDN0108347.1 type II secretion system F family protein [Yersinia rochesterensis]MDR5017508.1 type II secretion system F family protein [Yersinia rochesterensis]
MIYYIILSSGILLLLLSNFKWMKIKKSIVNDNRKKSVSDNLFILFSKKIISEWLQYLHGIINDKNKLHIAMPIIYSICVFFINTLWFHFNIVLIFIFMFISIVFFQVKLSRKIHHSFFKQNFPEVLLMINMAVSSGASINQVLERCGQEINGPLGHEMSLICRRLNLGESPEIVFYDAYKRFHYPEFYFLITIILLNLQQGGQLKELTSRLSQVITKNKNSEQKKAVMTAQTRMSVNIICFMPIAFSLLLYFIDSTSIESMWNHPVGEIIFYYIITSEIIGIFLIRKMLRKAL